MRLSRCIYNLPVLSLCSLALTLLETHRTSRPASPLEPLHVAGTTSHAPPPTVHLYAPMVLFCPIWTCSFIIHFISASPRKTTSERQNPQGFTNIYTHICPPGLTNLVLHLLIDLRLKRKSFVILMSTLFRTNHCFVWRALETQIWLFCSDPVYLGWCACWLLVPRQGNFSSSLSISVTVSQSCCANWALRMAPGTWEASN